MNTKKIIGILLVLGSLALGYTGFNKVANNNASIEVLDLEVDVSNDSGKTEGYVYIAAAVALFIGGIYSINKKS
ncbi:hypothetical protein [Urechidicola croceus]|uniref:DUF3185 domain-containing protein n=1 Tax=Urechidicola croceus TaxID=1850246 RepID=A0A1D8P3Z8_9FLAO|nr:hypothetical protein [Urechidicola croceus]AOW19302.1 hypothetical protein LPB138_00775 [Urechidicola croceus]